MTTESRFKPWMLVSAAWVLPAVFASVNRVAQTHLSGWDPATLRELIWQSGDWLLYAFLTPAAFAISSRWPLVRPFLTRRVILHLVFSLLFCFAWATFGKLFQGALYFLFEATSAIELLRTEQFYREAFVGWLSWIFTTLPFGIAVYLCVVGVEHAIRYFVEARDREVEVSRLSEQLATARLSALQAQVNPHFLFNTLNTIAVLIRDNEGKPAVRIVEQLAEMLRTTLSSHTATEVTLSEELELVRRYVAIEEARFSDRLRPEFDIDETLLRSVLPAFALQHLVENAIRHGITKELDAGKLRIAARRDGDILEISVTDDGPGIERRTDFPKGHGISNTRERLEALYGDKASLELLQGEKKGTIAVLRVPYLERDEPASS